MLNKADPWVSDQNVPLGFALGRIRETGHQLKRGNVGEHTKNVVLSLLDGINENDL